MGAPYLKLPTLWIKEGHNSEELADLESMGIDTDTDEYYIHGYLYVFISQITAFNSTSKGQVCLRLCDGNSYLIYMPFKEWITLLQTELCKA